MFYKLAIHMISTYTVYSIHIRNQSYLSESQRCIAITKLEKKNYLKSFEESIIDFYLNKSQSMSI